MTPLIGGIAVALVATAFVWLIASVRRPARGSMRKRHHGAVRGRAGAPVGGEGPEGRFVGERRGENGGREIAKGRRGERAGGSAAEEEEEGGRGSRRREEGVGVVSEADRRRLEAERELSRGRELAKGARRELKTLLLDLLAEVKEVSGERPRTSTPWTKPTMGKRGGPRRVAFGLANQPGEGETMATDNRTNEPSLPTARRGYDRDATDQLLAELRATWGGSSASESQPHAPPDNARAERDEMQAECERAKAELAQAQALAAALEQQLDDGREREKEITDALVVASRVRAESEREGQALKARYEEQGEAITAESELRAADILSAAEAEAEKIVANSKLKIRRLDQQVRNAEQLAVEARARLTAFLESLLTEIERRGTEDVSAVDVLLSRASDAAKRRRGRITAEREALAPQPEADQPDPVG